MKRALYIVLWDDRRKQGAFLLCQERAPYTRGRSTHAYPLARSVACVTPRAWEPCACAVANVKISKGPNWVRVFEVDLGESARYGRPLSVDDSGKTGIYFSHFFSLFCAFEQIFGKRTTFPICWSALTKMVGYQKK